VEGEAILSECAVFQAQSQEEPLSGCEGLLLPPCRYGAGTRLYKPAACHREFSLMVAPSALGPTRSAL
jgi:hypothetical protein